MTFKKIILKTLVIITFIENSEYKDIYISKNSKNITEDKINELPYIVSLRYSSENQYKCTGSILNEYWILTAAHCVCYSQ